MKENPRVMDIKVILDLGLLRNRHFHSPSVHQQGWWPQSWAEEQRKTDRFLAEFIYKFHWNHIIYSKDLYLKESSNLTKTCLFLSRCSWTCYSLMAHDRLPCLQISCRCQCFSSLVNLSILLFLFYLCWHCASEGNQAEYQAFPCLSWDKVLQGKTEDAKLASVGTCKLGTILKCDSTSGREIVKNGTQDSEEESLSTLIHLKY